MIKLSISGKPLKPCPFCGGEAEIWVSDVSDRAVIYCRGCDAQIQIKPNEEEAIEAWNKRVGEVTEYEHKRLFTI